MTDPTPSKTNRIRSVTIEGFRSLRKIENLELPQLAVLILGIFPDGTYCENRARPTDRRAYRRRSDPRKVSGLQRMGRQSASLGSGRLASAPPLQHRHHPHVPAIGRRHDLFAHAPERDRHRAFAHAQIAHFEPIDALRQRRLIDAHFASHRIDRHA